jgi:hypothetical protein
MKIVINTAIDLDNIKATNAVARVVNSAFETGRNPAWFEVKSLSKGGFIYAAYSGQAKGFHSLSISGKPAIKEWTLEARLNYKGYKSPWVTVTAESAVKRWVEMSNDMKLKFLAKKAKAYLEYLAALSQGDEEKAESVLLVDYKPDGFHDDALAQYAIAGEVAFG